jgi:soluble cytochrome b562
MQSKRTLILLLALVLAVINLGFMPAKVTSHAPALNSVTSWETSSAPIRAEPQKKVRLQISVKDPEGNPVGNAKVNVWHDRVGPLGGTASYQADTTPDGVAVLEVETTKNFFNSLPELSLVIRVVKTDFEVGVDQIAYTAGTVPDSITRTITIRKNALQAGTMTIVVQVVTAAREPVEGAQVDVWANTWPLRENSSAQTDGGGTAQVSARLFDDFEIKVNKEGFSEVSMPLKLPGNSIPRVAGPFTVTLAKPTGNVITVSVIDQDNHQGVADARVVLSGLNVIAYQSGTTDASGSATLVIPQSGMFAVSISQSTYEKLGGAEVKIAEGEKNQTFVFELKPKQKKNAGPNSIAVTVMAADKSEPGAVVRTNLLLSDASVTVVHAGGQITEVTDASGEARVSGDFEGNVQVVVEASGYRRQSKTVNVRETIRATGSHSAVTFTLQPEKTDDYVEVTVLASEKDCALYCPPIEGAIVTAADVSATTDASGRATLHGSFDDVSIKVVKSGFRSQVKQVSSSRPNRFYKGVAHGAVTFILQPDKTEDSVDVVVVSVNPAGNSSPIAGATVTAGTATATTDSTGHAKLTGKFGEAAQVAAQANGYATKSEAVTISQSSHTGSVTIALQPNVRLIVEVRDSASPNDPIEDAVVYLRLNDRPVGGGSRYTNAQGEARIELTDDSVLTLAKIRSGLKIYATKEKYLIRDSAITADLLQPSTEPRRVTVFLRRDWEDLRKAVDKLEQSVLAWNNDLSLANQAIALVRKLAEEAPPAQQRVADLVKEIEATRPALANNANGVSVAGSRCREAARLRTNIQGYKIQADTNEQALKTLIDNASSLIATCSTAKDADSVKAIYRTATDLARSINALEKKAAKENKDLADMSGLQTDVKQIADEVDKRLAQLEGEVKQAQAAVTAAGTYFIKAENLSNSLKQRHGTLTGQLQALKTQFGLDQPIEGLPADLSQRVAVMTQLLGAQNNNVFGGPNQEWLKTVQEAATQIEADVARAKAVLAVFKNDKSAQCEVETMNDVVQQIGAINTSATIELAAAALNEKAEVCINKNACNAARTEVLGLLEQGAIDSAEAIIKAAGNKGCDVAGLDEELDYWKTVRDGVVYVKALGEECKFQEVVEWSTKLPEAVRKKPLMLKALTEAYNGMKAQQTINQLRNSAKAEVGRTHKMASAEPFIKQAEQVAAPYACLVKEAAKFRSDYKITGVINNAPEYSGPGTNSGPPVVEEIPEEAVKKPSTNNTNRTGTRTTTPEVEEIPEEAVRRNNPSSGGASTNTSTASPGVRPCTADEAAAFMKMAGSAHSYRMNISIGGSCEQATGTYRVTEYCEGVDETYNSTTPRVNGRFTGRMEGGSLRVTYDQPASPHSAPQNGSGYCSLNGDGTFSCGGFGCENNFKKQ